MAHGIQEFVFKIQLGYIVLYPIYPLTSYKLTKRLSHYNIARIIQEFGTHFLHIIDLSIFDLIHAVIAKELNDICISKPLESHQSIVAGVH